MIKTRYPSTLTLHSHRRNRRRLQKKGLHERSKTVCKHYTLLVLNNCKQRRAGQGTRLQNFYIMQEAESWAREEGVAVNKATELFYIARGREMDKEEGGRGREEGYYTARDGELAGAWEQG